MSANGTKRPDDIIIDNVTPMISVLYKQLPDDIIIDNVTPTISVYEQLQRDTDICEDQFFGPNLTGAKCGNPTPSCFELTPSIKFTVEYNIQCNGTPDQCLKPWNFIVEDTFDDCQSGCYGFKINDNLDELFLCSLHLSYYSPQLNPDVNYIGFVFAGIKSGDSWYYNNGNENSNPNKKYR